MTVVGPSRAAWRTSSYSGANGSCIEVTGTAPGVVAVRDSKDPDGPELAFTARQWTAFATALKGHAAARVRLGRGALAGIPAGAFSCRRRARPFAVSGRSWGLFPRWRCLAVPGASAVPGWFPAGAGVGAVRESSVARAARPRAGEGARRGCGGNQGKPGLWGFPLVSPRCLHIPCPEGAARHLRMPRASAAPWAPSTAMRGGLACTFPGHGYGEFPHLFLNYFPLLHFERSGAGVILTSPSGPLGVGVRSGSRKRNAATPSSQAGGGAGRRQRCAAAAPASAPLCARCAGAAMLVQHAKLIGLVTIA